MDNWATPWFLNGTFGGPCLVRERGTYVFQEIGTFSTLAELVALVQRALSTQTQVAAIVKEDGTRVEKETDVLFLSAGQKLEIVFMNKFYWIVSMEQRREWGNEFYNIVRDMNGKMTGDQARAIFTTSLLSNQELAVIWDLADVDKDSCLNLLEYLLARFLIQARQQNQTIPKPLPPTLIEPLTLNHSTAPTAVTPFEVKDKKSPSRPPPVIKIDRQKTLPSDKSKTEKSQTKVRPGSSDKARFRDKKADTLPLPGESVWVIPKGKFALYSQVFNLHNDGGYITGPKALELFSRSGLPNSTLAQLWSLASINNGNSLDATEFKIAMHLISNLLQGIELPITTPIDLIESAKAKMSRTVSNSSFTFETPPSIQLGQSGVTGQISPSNPQPQLTPISPMNPSPSSSPQIGLSQLIPSGQSAYAPMNLMGGSNNTPINPQTGWFNPSFGINPPQQTPQWPTPIQLPGSNAGSPVLPGPGEIEIGSLRIDPNSIQRTKVIGAGSFARVWCGIFNGEVVAIKDISYRSENEIEMWKKEVSLLLKLQHANYLVRIKGYCTSQNYLTIVMEFMDGGSLFDLIHNKQKKVTWSMLNKVRVMRHIAKAIESVHQENIIHRDIKSMNILLDRTGTAKLTDLGCSRLVRMETMTKGVGSPLWMAPEVARGMSYTFPCDIFSFGVVCFEIFNEVLPEYDLHNQQVIIPPDCIGSTVIRECTRITPERRPTAPMLIGALDMLISTLTITAARVFIANHVGGNSFTGELPKLEDTSAWYNMFLSFDRETFDVLLSSGLNQK